MIMILTNDFATGLLRYILRLALTLELLELSCKPALIRLSRFAGGRRFSSAR
jgi:hypothetical protein